MEEKRNPIAIIVTRFGKIKVELYPKEAPNTVNCFISLAKKGLFDHRKIRRIAPGFVLQPSYSDFEDERCAISLDGGYAAFGKVTEGWEVVEQITALPTEKVDIGIPGVDVNEPIEPEYMEKVIVETWGVEYDEPVILG